MSFPSSCTCGYPIGDYHEIFMKAAKIKTANYFASTGNNVDPTKVNNVTADTRRIQTSESDSHVGQDVNTHPGMGDILDSLQITKICCRAKMLGMVDFFKLRENRYMAMLGEGKLTGAQLNGQN